MSSTKRCTIGLPATGIKGLGTVSVCGLMRLPMPAIGIIIFIWSIKSHKSKKIAFILF